VDQGEDELEAARGLSPREEHSQVGLETRRTVGRGMQGHLVQAGLEQVGVVEQGQLAWEAEGEAREVDYQWMEAAPGEGLDYCAMQPRSSVVMEEAWESGWGEASEVVFVVV
jgi:hypothetical protein